MKKSNFVSKLEIRKKVFREPKEANQVDSVLAEYTRSINQFGNNAECGKNGALLFCVVGELFINKAQNQILISKEPS